MKEGKGGREGVSLSLFRILRQCQEGGKSRQGQKPLFLFSKDGGKVGSGGGGVQVTVVRACTEIGKVAGVGTACSSNVGS